MGFRCGFALLVGAGTEVVSNALEGAGVVLSALGAGAVAVLSALGAGAGVVV